MIGSDSDARRRKRVAGGETARISPVSGVICDRSLGCLCDLKGVKDLFPQRPPSFQV